MIDRVERLVLNDSRIKVAELASECRISNGRVYTIVHENLGMSEVSARWVHRRSPANVGIEQITSGSIQGQSRTLSFAYWI